MVGVSAATPSERGESTRAITKLMIVFMIGFLSRMSVIESYEAQPVNRLKLKKEDSKGEEQYVKSATIYLRIRFACRGRFARYDLARRPLCISGHSAGRGTPSVWIRSRVRPP